MVVMIIMLAIIQLSRRIADANVINPNNVLIFQSSDAILLTFLSSLLFLIILIAFSKTIFFDKREDFGIKTMKSPRSIWFFLLTISFISQIFILLDVALVNVFLVTGPAKVLQFFALWCFGL